MISQFSLKSFKSIIDLTLDLSFKNGTQDDYTFSAGGMGAVDQNHRGFGIFQDIVTTAIRWGNYEDMDWHEHNTLITNIPVNRAFTSIGFNPTNHVMTLHGWVDELRNYGK